MCFGIGFLGGIRPADRNFPDLPPFQRKQSSFILQQNDRFARSPKGKFLMSLRADNPVAFLKILHVRTVKKPQLELHPENVPDPAVNHLHRDCSLLNQFPQRQHIGIRRTEGAPYIQSCQNALKHRFFHIG